MHTGHFNSFTLEKPSIMQVEIQSQFPFGIVDENQVPVFCGPSYAQFLKEVKSEDVYWFIGYEDNAPALVIPFAVKKKYFFKKGYFLTAVLNLSGLSEPSEKKFLELIIRQIKAKKLCDWIEQPPNWAIFRTIPPDSIFCKFGSYIIDMRGKNESDLLGSFQGKNRQSLSRATRDGVVIKNGVEHLNDALAVLNELSGREGLKQPKLTELQKMVDILQDKVLIYTAFYKDIPQATGILFSNKYCSYGIHGGAIKQASQGANALLTWHSIKDSNAIGVQFFDFVGARVNPAPGSKYERIQRFKEHFGAEMVQGYLWKMPVSRTKYNIYNLIIKAYYLLRLKKYPGDIIDQELKREANEKNSTHN